MDDNPVTVRRRRYNQLLTTSNGVSRRSSVPVNASKNSALSWPSIPRAAAPPAPIVFCAGSTTCLGTTDMPIGLLSDAESEAGTVIVPSGGALLLFTDGLTDSISGNDPEGHRGARPSGASAPRLRDALADNLVDNLNRPVSQNGFTRTRLRSHTQLLGVLFSSLWAASNEQYHSTVRRSRRYPSVGKWSGRTSSPMDRACPGVRSMKPLSSSVLIIW